MPNRAVWGTSAVPDLNSKAGDPLEVPCVHRGDLVVDGKCSRTDEEIVRSHRLPSSQQLGP